MLRHPPEIRGQIKISLKNLVKQPKPCSVTGPGLQHLFLGLWQDTTTANIFTWLSNWHLWSEKPEVAPLRPPHPLPCPLPRCAVPHRSSESHHAPACCCTGNRKAGREAAGLAPRSTDTCGVSWDAAGGDPRHGVWSEALWFVPCRDFTGRKKERVCVSVSRGI